MNVAQQKKHINKYSEWVTDPTICKDPLVSVLMWTHNDVEFIDQAISSVLEQQAEFPFEFVISDDMSTDGTLEKLLEYQEKHPKIIRLVLSKKNLWSTGLITQRLLSEGHGKYLALSHGDDYWTDPQKLQ